MTNTLTQELTTPLSEPSGINSIDNQPRLGDLYTPGVRAPQDDITALKKICQAAEDGNLEAWAYLVKMIRAGYGLPHEACKIVLWLRQLLKKGNAGALHVLGVVYEEGYCVQQDKTEASRWYRMAAERGNRAAQAYLGWMYLEGKGTQQDDDEAYKWLRLSGGNTPVTPANGMPLPATAATKKDPVQRARDEQEWLSHSFLSAKAGNAFAQFYLGKMYEDGFNIDPDVRRAVYWYRKAAEQGHQYAQVRLGDLYFRYNDSEAFNWYQRAEEQENDEACFKLGCLYSGDYIVNRDDVKALACYLRAADTRYVVQTKAHAQERLGWVHETGRGVPKDHAQAMRCFQQAEQKYCVSLSYWEVFHEPFPALSGMQNKAACQAAAERGDPMAQTALGRLYETGAEGVAQNIPQALMWYRYAAYQDYAAAQTCLGRLYEARRGAARDYREAADWYRQAALLGDAQAQFRLGWLCHKGFGLAQDDQQARHWYEQAARKGNDNAQLGLGYLESDPRLRLKWFTQAAKLGNTIAQFNVGALSAQEKGVFQKSKTLKWLQLAADSGDRQGQFLTGWKYATGIGAARNDAKAVRYLQLAAQQGFEPALLTLEAMLWRKE